MMHQTLLITRQTIKERDYIITALYDGNRAIELYCQETGKSSILGNIYVGRVKDVVKNLNAAFIEIAPGCACYLSLEDYKNPVFVKKINSPNLVQGDELLVQVVKESMKTKPPQVTTNLNFQGRYLALTTGNTLLGISKKLGSEKREWLKNVLTPFKQERFGLVARTNSQDAAEEDIKTELFRLQEQAERLLNAAPHRTCFSCMLEQRPEYLNYLQNIRTEYLKKIVTDDIQLFNEMKDYMQELQPKEQELLTLYQDKTLPLLKLYSLEKELEDALKEKVWLKSGAYLIIQPTEALTVVDVNSGKSTVKKKPEEHYLKVNLEAAAETARQLRLRNISGIIIIDFIDMRSQENRELLMEELKRCLSLDPVPAKLIDMTKLNLVEITRKKVRRSLREELM